MALFDTDNGFLLADDETIGRGGRGSVLPVILASDYAIDAPCDELVCKVVERRFRSPGRRLKVELLREIGTGAGSSHAAGMSERSADEVAWPLGSIFHDGEWVGYVMRRARGRSLSEVREDDRVSPVKKIQLARRMCELVGWMHRLGIVVGDVNMANVMYDELDDRLVLIDVDSLQLVDAASQAVYPTVESREKSPEMLDGALGETVLTSRSDDFLMAVEVFRMLFGVHPLDEYRKDTPAAKVRAENARARRFAYELAGRSCSVGAFGNELAALFRRSFSGAYEGIPSCGDYARALRSLEAKRPVPGAARGNTPLRRVGGFADCLRAKLAVLAGGFDMRAAKRAAGLAAAAACAWLATPPLFDACVWLASEGQIWLSEAQSWLVGIKAWLETGFIAMDVWVQEAGDALFELKVAAADVLSEAGAAFEDLRMRLCELLGEVAREL